jgi:hypothetical protein
MIRPPGLKNLIKAKANTFTIPGSGPTSPNISGANRHDSRVRLVC